MVCLKNLHTRFRSEKEKKCFISNKFKGRYCPLYIYNCIELKLTIINLYKKWFLGNGNIFLLWIPSNPKHLNWENLYLM